MLFALTTMALEVTTTTTGLVEETATCTRATSWTARTASVPPCRCLTASVTLAGVGPGVRSLHPPNTLWQLEVCQEKSTLQPLCQPLLVLLGKASQGPTTRETTCSAA